MRTLSPDERREAQVASGVVVEGVSGAAALAGIQRGDIVLELNGIPVTSAEAFGLIARRSMGTAALLVQRGDVKMFVPVHVG